MMMVEEVDRSLDQPSSSTSSIRAIKRGDVHRITSGQVVLDIQSAVKELIENALDAGATQIEVRFKEYGADLIEVTDNGSGIESSNYDSLALKHHTSKLQDFADLIRVTTFGFRGEALSSLCELAKVQFITATQSEDPVGTILEMNRDGTIQSRDRKVARKRGTTVSVSDLFHSLPVRRRELIKNVKREFAKAQALLQAYAIISSGVRWVVSNTVRGKKNTIMTIPASSSGNHLSANVSAIFGQRATPDLVPLNLQLSLSALQRRSTASSRKQMVYDEDEGEMDDADSEQPLLRIVGLISRPSIGCGRTSSDRCFLYVNGRPWDSPKIVRAFNEVYRQFNIQQYPMVIANFEVQGDQYDVNVSPDKRTLFLHKESEILERLKVELEEAFNPYQSVMRVNDHSSHSPNTEVLTKAKDKGRHDSDEPSESATWSNVNVAEFANGRRRRSSDSSSKVDERAEGVAALPKRARRNDDSEEMLPPSSSIQSDDVEMSQGSEITTNSMTHRNRTSTTSSTSPLKRTSAGLPKSILAPIQGPGRAKALSSRQTLLNFDSDLRSFAAPHSESISNDQSDTEDLNQEDEAVEAVDAQDYPADEIMVGEQSFEGVNEDNESREDERHSDSDSSHTATAEEETLEQNHQGNCDKAIALPVNAEALIDESQSNESISCEKSKTGMIEQIQTQDDIDDDAVEAERVEPDGNSEDLSENQLPSNGKQKNVRMDGKGVLHIPFSLDKVMKRLAALNVPSASSRIDKDVSVKSTALKDAAIEQSDTETVGKILSRFIEKADFEKMEVLGQFNLGFIIARRSKNGGEEDDLMIIDQHAADEKYNFERLTNTTKLQTQRLIVPRTLQLSPSDELTAVDHKEALNAHGFQIEIDEEAQPGSRIRLIALPVSQRITFSVEDLEEVLHKLADEQPNSQRAFSIRCSKWRNVLASRACRSSIMIGTALKSGKMETVIRHLSTLDQPWNCPHGRPTMRHLYDLNAKRSSNLANIQSGSAIDWTTLS